LWEQQKISVACEHLATAITERMMSLVQPQVFVGGCEHSILVACVADEYHQLGARMIADLCELRGWRGYFLGADTPLPDLLRAIEEHQPTVLGLSVSIFLNLPKLLAAIDAVTQKYSELPILVGGQAFCWGGVEALRAYPRVSYLATVDELEQRLAAYER
jgi:methanogenic corrinoid protein MtbC1